MQITPAPLPAAVAEIAPTTAPADGRVQGTIQDGQGIVYDIGNFNTGQRGELVDMSTEVDITARVYHQDGGEIPTQPLTYPDRRGRMFIAPRDGVYYAHISAEEDGERVPAPTQSGRAVASSDFAIRQITRQYICVFTRFEDATSTEPLVLVRPVPMPDPDNPDAPLDTRPDLQVQNSGALLGRVSQGATGWESPLTVVAGDPFSVQLLVLNEGSSPVLRSPSVTLTFLRSDDDTTIEDTDAAASQGNTVTVPGLRQVARNDEGELNYVERYILTPNAPTSATYPQTYYYGGCVTRHFAESNRNNNCSPRPITVMVAAPPRLSNLALSGVTLSPSFAHNIAAYTADVASAVTQTTVTATAAGSGRVTTITPADADSATDGHQVNLASGANRVRVTVTEGSRTRDYTVTIYRAVAALSALALSSGADDDVALSPAFDRDTTAYSAEVAYTVEQTTVSATPLAGSVAITPADADSATNGHQVALAVGENLVRVTVTGAGARIARTYTVIVNRAPASPALSDLALSGEATLTPTMFDRDTTVYTASVANTVAQTTVTATPAGSGRVTIAPGDADSAMDGHQVNLAVGANRVRVTVTEGGETQIYAITIFRAPPTLSALALSVGTLSPAFDSDILLYTAAVASTVTETTVTATPVSGSVTIMPADADSATDGHQVNLAVGANLVLVTVTGTGARNVTRTYTVIVDRAPPALSALALSGVTLAPAFAGGIPAYTAEVANTVTQTTVSATPVSGSVAIMPADAASGTSGHQVALDVGANEISVTVTAGGEMRTYTVTVNRAPPALSALALSGGATLSPAFDGDTLAYTAVVANTVTQTTVTATAAGSGSVAITPADDDNAMSGHQVDLDVGANMISVTVTGAGSSTQIYTVTVNRLSDGADLTVSAMTVSPTSISAGQRATLRATVTNNGDTQSPSTTLVFYDSDDATITTADESVSNAQPVAALASGASVTVSVTLPPETQSSAGTYYYGACVSAVADESNTANNCSAGARYMVEVSGTPDPGGPGAGPGVGPVGPGAGTGGGGLVAENLQVTPTRFAPGASVTASVTVRNSGFEASDTASLEFLALVGDNSVILHSVSIASLAAGATRSYRESFTVSRTQAPAGANQFSILACIDMYPCEMVDVRFQ